LGMRCHEHTWGSPTERNQLAAACTGPTSRFDNDAPCPQKDAIGVCKLTAVTTYVYATYTDLDGFRASCSENGGTYEAAGGCSATPPGAGMIIAIGLGLARRRRRRYARRTDQNGTSIRRR